MATIAQMRYGLTLRPTYDQVLNSYLSGGPQIKKPDRTATFIRASPQYQNLLKTDFILINFHPPSCQEVMRFIKKEINQYLKF